METIQELFAGFEAAMMEELFFASDKLPSGFKFDNADEVSAGQIARKLNKRDAKRASKARSQSAKMDKNGNMVGSPERMAAIENYRLQAESGVDELIPCDADFAKLNNNMITLCGLIGMDDEE